MRVKCTTLWLPKKGNTQEEYEDAAAPLEALDSEVETFRCAVADGATETSFSGLWAKLLVDGFVAGTDRQALKQKWQSSVHDGKELPWYAEEKAQSGAYAALVCLTLNQRDKSGGTWEVEALGDSCLILLRQADFLVKFPLTRSDEFNSNPLLLSSNLDDGQDHGEIFSRVSGQWVPGDVFYLLSDAIARWTYKRQEEHGDAPFYLQSMKKPEDLVEFAAVQRELIDEESRPLMRNDDVTLMRVEVE